ncbi:MAG: hypothetical protein ACP5HU_07060 [Phycisphaerae bacterium]
MRKRLLQIGVSALCLLCVLAVAGAQPDEPTITRRGDNLAEVIITGQGMDKAEAVRDAQRRAVERAAGTYVFSESQVEDFTLVRDTILARSAGYVHSYDIISEETAPDGIVSVKCRVVVSIQGIEDTWGVVTNLLEQMGRPKIMVFIVERIEKDDWQTETVGTSTVQTAIEEILQESGFLLVNREQIDAIQQRDLESAIAEDDAAKAQAVAKRFGAQLFITGSANAARGQVRNISGMTLHTYEAESNIKCYRSDTGQLLSSVPGSATRGAQRVWRSAAKQALQSQAQQVAPRVREDILRFWMDAMSGRGEVKLEVRDVSFQQYVQIKGMLEEMEDVSSVANVNYHNQIVECSLQSRVTAEQLAVKMVETMGELEITDVSQNVIKARYAAGE